MGGGGGGGGHGGAEGGRAAGGGQNGVPVECLAAVQSMANMTVGPTCSSGTAQEALIISHTETGEVRGGSRGWAVLCVCLFSCACACECVVMKHTAHNMRLRMTGPTSGHPVTTSCNHVTIILHV